MHDLPSQFIEVAGIRLHVRDTGPKTAPALIFLHGFGSSLQTWDDWARDLEADHRVIRYDLPGFGLTGADPTTDYSDRRSIAVLLALMDRLGVARASVVGNSMGGRIAWTFAALNPNRTDKLVLISPDGFASPGLEYGATSKAPLMIRALPYVLPSFMLRDSLAPAFANADVMTEALFTRYRDMMLAPGVRQAIVDRMNQMALVDPVPLLKAHPGPNLADVGRKRRHDPVCKLGGLPASVAKCDARGASGYRAYTAGGSADDRSDRSEVPGQVSRFASSLSTERGQEARAMARRKIAKRTRGR